MSRMKIEHFYHLATILIRHVMAPFVARSRKKKKIINKYHIVLCLHGGAYQLEAKFC
jgi:hypothetical protein